MIKGSLCSPGEHNDLASNSLWKEGWEAMEAAAFCETCNKQRPDTSLLGPVPSVLQLILHPTNLL